MPVRRDRINIPTVAVAVDYFIQHLRVGQTKSIKDFISVLRGPNSRVVGRKASGPALAKSELGQLRCDRLEAYLVSEWFQARHPDGLAPATVKRNMSHLRGFLTYAAGQGWIDERVLAACVSVKDSNPVRDWLRPRQIEAISDLVDAGDFDAYERFAFQTLRDTGVRPAELIAIRPAHLKRDEKQLHVPAGKGRGDGKPRDIPISTAYLAAFDAHCRRYGLGPGDAVFFRRPNIPAGGRAGEMIRRHEISRPSTAKPIREILRKIDAAARLELEPELVPSFTVTPKVLRRTYACSASIQFAMGVGGLDLHSLKEAMGHASLDTTAIYLVDSHAYIQQHKREFDLRAGNRELLELIKEQELPNAS